MENFIGNMFENRDWLVNMGDARTQQFQFHRLYF